MRYDQAMKAARTIARKEKVRMVVVLQPDEFETKTTGYQYCPELARLLLFPIGERIAEINERGFAFFKF